MGTERGSRAVADAIQDIEVEKIRGPGDSGNVKLGSFWEDQVFSILVTVLPLNGATALALGSEGILPCFFCNQLKWEVVDHY